MWGQLIGAGVSLLGANHSANAAADAADNAQQISKQYADMNADDFSFYKDNYQPQESKLIDMASGVDTQQVIDNGLKTFDGLLGRQQATSDRNLGRFGAKQNTAANNTNNLQAVLGNTAARTNFANTTRDTLENRNMGLSQEMIGIGRDLNVNAMGAIGSAASTANSAQKAAGVIASNNVNNAMQNIGSGVMNYLSQPSASYGNSYGGSNANFDSINASNASWSDFGGNPTSFDSINASNATWDMF